MQHRMKTHPLCTEQIEALLLQAHSGCLATLNTDGTPYVTPVHFLYHGGAIYVHGLPKGQKIDNIRADSRVSMTVYHMNGLLLDPDGKPCDTNTEYQSVILSGRAELVEDQEHKQVILHKIVGKYTPHLNGNELPEPMVRGTAIIRIQIMDMTGKYYN